MGVVLLVRHGQASFGADDYDVLSETGWEQCRALGRWLADRGEAPAHVVRGGLRRHRESWEAIADGLGRSTPQAQVDDRWDELDVGAVFAAALEGGPLDRAAFQERYELAMLHWTQGRDDDALFPETWAAFSDRVLGALDDAAAADGPTLVVTSGGPVGVAAAALLTDPEAARDPALLGPAYRRLVTTVVNSAVTRVVVGSSGTRLLTYNEHPHLTREQVTYR